MKYELNESQIDLILRGLDALAEAAENESRCTDDADIREGNDSTVKQVQALYTYLRTKGEYIQSGEHYFKLVDVVPLGYEIWNIGKNMVDGYLPFCRLKPVQPFPGGRKIEADTLRAMKCYGAQVILAAIGYGPNTPAQMEQFIQEHEGQKTHSPTVERMKAALPYMRQLRWEGLE